MIDYTTYTIYISLLAVYIKHVCNDEINHLKCLINPVEIYVNMLHDVDPKHIEPTRKMSEDRDY